jgi:hypothetical protein
LLTRTAELGDPLIAFDLRHRPPGIALDHHISNSVAPGPLEGDAD